MWLLFDLACKLELRLLVCRDGAGALLLASDTRSISGGVADGLVSMVRDL